MTKDNSGRLHTLVECTNCKGSGLEPFLDNTKPCRKCKGKGVRTCLG